MRSIWAFASMALGVSLIALAEPHMHAWTAAALGCGLLSYAGALALGVGLVTLVCNDDVERAGKRLLIHLLKRGAPHD